MGLGRNGRRRSRRLKERAKEKDTILVQVLHNSYKYSSEFYTMNLNMNTVAKHPSILLNECGMSDMVALGSVIYALGGYTSVEDHDPFNKIPDLSQNHHIHLGASFLDLNNVKGKHHQHQDSNKWKAAPCMEFKRYFPRCAALCGKVYVFGGSAMSIGEEFDPNIGRWETLNPPSSIVVKTGCCVSNPVLADEKNGRLILHLRHIDSLYAYYPHTRTWDCLVQSFRQWPRPESSEPAVTLADDVIYMHKPCFKLGCTCVTAYDLVTKAWLKVSWSSRFGNNVYTTDFDAFLHLGNGMFCLALYCPNYHIVPCQTNIYFIRLKIERTSPEEILITPGPIDCLPIERGRYKCMNFLVL